MYVLTYLGGKRRGEKEEKEKKNIQRKKKERQLYKSTMY